MAMMAEILDGVAEAVRTVEKCSVLINDVGPNLTYPLWRIKILDDAEIERLVQGRFQYSMDLDIWYILNERGEIKDLQGEIIDVAERLVFALEFISAGGRKFMGSEMHYRVTDGVLHFFVTYKWQTVQTAEEPKMESLKVKPKKEG